MKFKKRLQKKRIILKKWVFNGLGQLLFILGLINVAFGIYYYNFGYSSAGFTTTKSGARTYGTVDYPILLIMGAVICVFALIIGIHKVDKVVVSE